MIYVEKVKVLDTPYDKVLKEGFEFTCTEVNLFVGDQGCGKSTLLNMMHSVSAQLKISVSDFVKKNGVETFLFDSEKQNPRVMNLDQAPDYGAALYSHFRSHGEVLSEYTVDGINKAKDCVMFFDEPESGLSINNQYKLVKAIKGAVKRNCQFFIATHCIPLIESFDVISIEHLKQMSGEQFINLCKKKANKK